MRPPNDNDDPRLNDPEWDFLAEYPLIELLVDIDLRDTAEAGILSQAFLSLGIQPSLLDIIERKLIGFAAEAPAQLNQRRFEAPTFVRLYFHRKTVSGHPALGAPGQGREERAAKPSQIFHHSDAELYGGWGYFLIERGAGFAPNSTVCTYNLVDLYLYKEGE